MTPRSRIWTLPLFAALVVAAAGWDEPEGPAAPRRKGASPVGVRDRARLFSPGAIRAATKILREIEESGRRWEVLIESDDALDGARPGDLATANARACGLRGLSVVIAKKEQAVGARPTDEAEEAFPADELALIDGAFARGFAEDDYDRGLKATAAEIRRAALGVGVRDHARRFSPEAVASANEALEDLQRLTHWGAVVETWTPEAQAGRPLRELALERVRTLGIQGLYVAVPAAGETPVAEPSREARPVFSPPHQKVIAEAVAGMEKPDRALHAAVAAIRKAIGSEMDIQAVAPGPAAPLQAEPVARAPRQAPSESALTPQGTPIREGLDVDTNDPVWNALAIVLGIVAVVLIVGLAAHVVRRARIPDEIALGDPTLPPPDYPGELGPFRRPPDPPG